MFTLTINVFCILLLPFIVLILMTVVTNTSENTDEKDDYAARLVRYGHADFFLYELENKKITESDIRSLHQMKLGEEERNAILESFNCMLFSNKDTEFLNHNVLVPQRAITCQKLAEYFISNYDITEEIDYMKIHFKEKIQEKLPDIVYVIDKDKESFKILDNIYQNANISN